MNLSVKQTHKHREQTVVAKTGGGHGERWIGSLALQTIIYRMDKQQGPTVEHRRLYSISCDKPQGTRI